MKWKTITEKPIPDIREFVAANVREGERLVHIGTDSLQGRRYTQFVTVLVILEPGKGGRVAYQRQLAPRIASLRERLLKEVWFSVTLALEINDVLPAQAGLTVHIDANPVDAKLCGRAAEYEFGSARMYCGQRKRSRPELSRLKSENVGSSAMIDPKKIAITKPTFIRHALSMIGSAVTRAHTIVRPMMTRPQKLSA